MIPDKEDALLVLSERIGYTFRNEELLKQALTHSSRANELHDGVTKDYERLEYLGDAVLEMVTSDYIYRTFPEAPEGAMTRLRASLVCEEALFERAGAFSLSDFIRLGRGEAHTGGRNKPSIVSDVFEALTGAIYLDGGIRPVRRFIRKFVLADAKTLTPVGDFKTRLQELVQRDGLGALVYQLVGEEGPEHRKTFRTAVCIGLRQLAEGEGRNKKASQQAAAEKALAVLAAEGRRL